MASLDDEEPFIHYERDGHTISGYKVNKEISVRVNKEEIIRTRSAILLKEQGYPPVYYFPIFDMMEGILEPSRRKTTCPFKGKANYYSLHVGGKKFENSVWQYSKCTKEFEPMRDYVAIYNNIVDRIDEV